MALDLTIDLPFYAEFNNAVNFFESNKIKTAGVNVTEAGMNHYYSPEFLKSLTQKEVNFLILHETFHLLFNHNARARMGGYDPSLSNIAMDMVINSIIVKDIKKKFIETIKDKKTGKNTVLFLPKEYEGSWVYEEVYDFLKMKKDESEKRRKKKEDEKIFSELFFKSDKPSFLDINLVSDYRGQYDVFKDSLLEFSKPDAISYMNNFVRKCIISFEKNQIVELFGHTDSIENDKETLSENRAILFKNAIIENIDEYSDNYVFSLSILESEKISTNDKIKLDYVLAYEEIVNPVMIKVRREELSNDSNEIDLLFETYRFTELNKMGLHNLQNICKKKSITFPDTTSFKKDLIDKAELLLIPIGKADTEKLIINDTDNEPSNIRTDVKKLPQYKEFIHISDAETKKAINRRVTYKFKECGGSDSGIGGGNSPESENQNNRDGYGENGQDGQEQGDLDWIFDESENNNGEFLDGHIEDSVSPELKEQFVRDVIERLNQRGFLSNNIEKTLNRLKKKRKDYLKEIKRAVSSMKGVLKEKTFKKPSRRGIFGVKGFKRYSTCINVLLDTSGSMDGYEEKSLEFIFRNDITINLIQCDAEIKCVESIENMKDLQKVVIRGGGGTELQPGLDYVKKHLSKLPTIILTDGICDSLDFSNYNQKVLVISNNKEIQIKASNNKVKQIVIKDYVE